MAVLLILVPIGLPTSKKITNLGMRGGGLAGPMDSTHSQNIHTGEG